MSLDKKQRQQARQLVGIAYSRELDFHLGELFKKFEEWKNNQIDCWDLNDLIHKFHDGISRDLYKIYNNDQHFLIERAISLNFLRKEELPAELQECIRDLRFFESERTSE
jgi:hypothetical protein